MTIDHLHSSHNLMLWILKIAFTRDPHNKVDSRKYVLVLMPWKQGDKNVEYCVHVQHIHLIFNILSTYVLVYM